MMKDATDVSSMAHIYALTLYNVSYEKQKEKEYLFRYWL